MMPFWLGLLTLTASVLADDYDFDESTVFAVNCGGHGHRGAYNIYYKGDDLKEGTASDHGKAYMFTNAHQNDVLLYQTERWHNDDFSYSFPVKEGEYVAILKFSEVFFIQPQMKLFEIRINDIPVIEDFDVYDASGGTGFAVDIYVNIRIHNGQILINDLPSRKYDGELKITLAKGQADNPKINALAVVRALPNEMPPLPPRHQTWEDTQDKKEWEMLKTYIEESGEEIDQSVVSGPPNQQQNPFEEESNVFFITIIASIVLIFPVVYFVYGRNAEE